MSELLRLHTHFPPFENGRAAPRLILCLCGAVSTPLLCADPARYPRSNRAELLLIYRTPSHTNPKRRDFSLKHAGQKSTKEELAERRKGPKRTEECRLKASTHIWEQDAGCSSHLTPTTVAGPGATCAPGPPFIKIFSGQSSPFLMGDFILKTRTDMSSGPFAFSVGGTGGKQAQNAVAIILDTALCIKISKNTNCIKKLLKIYRYPIAKRFSL